MGCQFYPHRHLGRTPPSHRLPTCHGALVLLSASAVQFAPTDIHLLVCGTAVLAVLPGGHRFAPNFGCASTRLCSAAASLPSTVAAPSSLPPPSPLHAVTRVCSCRASYDLAIRRRGRHVLRLHFYPFVPALTSSGFHVGTAGVFCNFIASSPTVKEFTLPVDSDVLILTFLPDSGSTAFVNAIKLTGKRGQRRWRVLMGTKAGGLKGSGFGE
jgi:hypothetical protein